MKNKALEKVEIVEGDITEMDVDAIVNAANNQLLLGAGVAGAIRKKGGPQIQRECDKIGPIKVGEAAITSGGNLKAKYVIHAASMGLGGVTTEESLRASSRASLLLADQSKIKTIAFPAIGTGIAGFPMQRCAEVMLEEIAQHLAGQTSLAKVYLVLFGKDAYSTFKEVYQRHQ